MHSSRPVGLAALSMMFAVTACPWLPAQSPTPSRAAAAGKSPRDAIRAMTFNIRYGTARDGESHWSRRQQQVLDRVRANRPDILGVQEALGFQVEFLQKGLPAYRSFGLGRDQGDRGESCKLFIRTSRLAVEASGTFWLSETPDQVASKSWGTSITRICTWAVVRDRRRHNRFLVANTHFDHRSPRARLESARLVSAWSKIFQLPVLVLGDFNAGEDRAPIRWLKQHGLRDSFRVVHPDAEDIGTSSNFVRRGRRKIDYVFCTKEFRVHGASIDKYTHEGRFPSDHCPVTAAVTLPGGPAPKLMPVLSGGWWHIGDNPKLGELQGERQQVVDHAIFRSTDGKWHLWACVRGTKIGRLLYHWEGESLHQQRWHAQGIAMRANQSFGESIDDWGGKEWIQAPHVIRHNGKFHMLYGGHRSESEHCQINLAISDDGRRFVRHRNDRGQSRVFVGPGEARDPMTIEIDGRYHCYYTGNPDPKNRRDVGGIYCRTSKDLVQWSKPQRVCFGGKPGKGMWSAECPHVVYREGFYYLFRTTSYREPLTYVYRSVDPMDFGLDRDDKLIGTIAVAAAEIVSDRVHDYISSVHDLGGGVQLSRLEWQPAK